MRNRTLKAELERQKLQSSIDITVAECLCVEASNRRMLVLNHSSLGLRLSYYFYWAKNTTVT